MKLSVLAILLCIVVASKTQGVLGGTEVMSESKVVDSLISRVQQLVGAVTLPGDLQKRLNDVVKTAGEAVKACDLTSGDNCFGVKLGEVQKSVQAIVDQAKLLNAASGPPTQN